MEQYDILIIGAGAAGISAAKEAYAQGCRSILLVEHKGYLGGILRQCTHRGFGENLTGPQYIDMLLTDFPEDVQYMLHTTVCSIHTDKTAVLSSAKTGKQTISFAQLILAAGCREIPAGALNIAGTRPHGVYTAGQMQEMMHIYDVHPKGPVVILGSGDVGLVMAAQIAQLGETVTLIEQNHVLGGMTRNQRNVEALAVPIVFDATIVELCGEKELNAVKLSSGEKLPCQTLLIAVGLCPNQELLYGLGQPEWLHLCGNCSRVHTMIESVVYEGKKAGAIACEMLRGVT